MAPPRHPSSIKASLAEQSSATKTRYARYRINGLHPELVALRLKLGQADLDGKGTAGRDGRAWDTS